MSTDRIQIHCDGACAGNGRRRNRGGWAAIVVHRQDHDRLAGVRTMASSTLAASYRSSIWRGLQPV